MISRLFILIFLFLLVSCSGNKQRDTYAIQQLAERHVSELKAPQLLREYILSIDKLTYLAL